MPSVWYPSNWQTAVPVSSDASPDTPVPTSVGPITITLYSTHVGTVTSCAADVTNCPASSLSTTLIPTAVTVTNVPSGVAQPTGAGLTWSSAYSAGVSSLAPEASSAVPSDNLTDAAQAT
ncbi:hypothetical protein M436DRAFT_59256, partial [Aureobasidium namibiae CBS 147.97]